jgi:hypothetical protein
VPKESEKELKEAFERTMKVRKLEKDVQISPMTGSSRLLLDFTEQEKEPPMPE